jgi:hypothetical protein
MLVGRHSTIGPWSVVLTLALVTGAPALAADAEHSAMAEQLFRDARSLMVAERNSEALEKLKASQELDPGLGTLLNLAECFERLGKTASAWGRFTEAEQLAQRDGDTTRARTAAQRARKLEPKLVRLRVIVPAVSDIGSPVIELDGSPLNTALLGTPIPVDPGTHDIRVRADGRKTWETSVNAITAGQVVEVTVPDLAREETPEVQSAPEGPAGAERQLATPNDSRAKIKPTLAVPGVSLAPAPTASAPHDNGTLSKPGLGTLIIGGAGIVALGAASGFGISSWVAWNSAKDQGCTGGHCPTPQAQSRAASAGTRADIATGGFVVGAGLLATAAAIYFFSDARSQAAPRVATRLTWDATLSRDRVAATMALSF